MIREDYAKRLVREASEAAIRAIEEGRQAEDVIESLEACLADVPDLSPEASQVSLAKTTVSVVREMVEARNDNRTMGVQSGIRGLDEKLRGFHAGEMIVVGGRPSMGKSTVATHIALNVARDGGKVVIVSREMSSEGLTHRIMAEVSGHRYFDFRNPASMSDEDFESVVRSAQGLVDVPIMFVPSHVATLRAILAAVRRARRTMGGLDLVVVDYLQLIHEPSARSLNEAVGKISGGLKAMAKQMGVPVVVLSQLSRGLEGRDDKRPRLSDLRDSGSIEQDADAVIFVYRPAYYLERQPTPKKIDDQMDLEAAKERLKNTLELIVAKQRMGPLGTVRVKCDLATNRIWEDDLF